MNPSSSLSNRLQLRLTARLVWAGLFLLFGVPDLFQFARGGDVSSLLTGIGYIALSVSCFLAPPTSEWSTTARMTQPAAIGAQKVHRTTEILCLAFIGVGIIVRVVTAYQDLA